jgi:hypothetical protein
MSINNNFIREKDMAKLQTKKLLSAQPEVIELQSEEIKVLALEDINAIINNKKINIKAGLEVQLNSTELLFLKDKVNIC